MPASSLTRNSRNSRDSIATSVPQQSAPVWRHLGKMARLGSVGCRPRSWDLPGFLSSPQHYCGELIEPIRSHERFPKPFDPQVRLLSVSAGSSPLQGAARNPRANAGCHSIPIGQEPRSGASWHLVSCHSTRKSRPLIAPRALATSGRRPGVRAKRAARGVAGRHLWTGRREKTGHPFTAIMKRCR